MKAISFYNSNINPAVVEYQKKVFDHFGIAIEQIETGMRHPEAIDFYLKTAEWDNICIFDIDCIPLRRDVVKVAERYCENGNLYGAIQNANHLQDYQYISPAFISFSKKTWESVGRPSFKEVGKYDVGGYFSSLCENCLYPLIPSDVEVPKWYLVNTEKTKVMFGLGTTYSDRVYHAFESRFNHESTSMFINKCKEVLGE